MNGGSLALLEQMKNILTDGYILTSRIIHISTTMGVIPFGLIIFYLYSIGEAVPGFSSDSAAIIELLTRIHAGAIIIMFPLSFYIFNRMLKQKGESLDDMSAPTVMEDSKMKPEQFLPLFRTASIIQLAIIEGCAFFGLVICFIAVDSGIMQTSPGYWINAISAVLMILFVLKTIPSRNRIEEVYKKVIS